MQKLPCQVVEYNAQHTEALRRIFFEARAARFSWLDPAHLQPSDFDETTAEEHILVAVNDGTPVGFITCWPPDNFIHSLFVDPGFSRQGVGKLLLNACLASIGRPATLKCVRENSDALQFYFSQGWTKLGQGKSSEGTYYLLSYD